MAQIEEKPSLAATDVFEQGKFSVKYIEKSNDPPKPLFIVTPTVEGTYPLYGFPFTTSETEEVNLAAAVTEWLSEGLPSNLPSNVRPNLQLLALSGHSRGGKAAFALALRYRAPTSLKFSLIIGLDPVAGPSPNKQTDPKILTYAPRSFDLTIPTAVIGTGLGPQRQLLGLLPACAPEGVNSSQFFYECKPPCWYFCATEYGHMDMLDDGLEARVGSCLCVGGKGGKDGFRKCLGGVFVAVLRACLDGKNGDVKAIVEHPGIAPVKLDPVIYVEA